MNRLPLRKLVGTVAAVGIAIAGVIGLIAFFNARDDSTTGPTTTAPARVNAGGLLRSGNVELSYADPKDRKPLLALAERNGPDSPELRAAGAAVVLRHDTSTAGVVARAYAATLQAKSATDPALQEFIDRWLGQGAAG